MRQTVEQAVPRLAFVVAEPASNWVGRRRELYLNRSRSAGIWAGCQTTGVLRVDGIVAQPKLVVSNHLGQQFHGYQCVEAMRSMSELGQRPLVRLVVIRGSTANVHGCGSARRSGDATCTRNELAMRECDVPDSHQ
jgi:hypothetical protein